MELNPKTLDDIKRDLRVSGISDEKIITEIGAALQSAGEAMQKADLVRAQQKMEAVRDLLKKGGVSGYDAAMQTNRIEDMLGWAADPANPKKPGLRHLDVPPLTASRPGFKTPSADALDIIAFTIRNKMKGKPAEQVERTIHIVEMELGMIGSELQNQNLQQADRVKNAQKLMTDVKTALMKGGIKDEGTAVDVANMIEDFANLRAAGVKPFQSKTPSR